MRRSAVAFDPESRPDGGVAPARHARRRRERGSAQDLRHSRSFPRGPWIAVAVVAAAVSVVLSIEAQRHPYLPIDLALTRGLQALSLGAAGAVLAALNALGFPPFVGIVDGCVIAALFLLGRRWAAVVSTFDASGSAALNHLVKHWVNRPRPGAMLVHVDRHIHNPAYPAGHVLNFTAFAGFLCCLAYVAMAPSWRRSAVITTLLTLVVLMGVARVDSGEHWPSDVAGGYALGLFWLAVTVLVYRWGAPRFAGRRVALPGLAGLALAIALLPHAARAAGAPAGDDSLAASRDVPWNPPEKLPRRRAWEQAVLLPGRIVSLPLSGLGYLGERGLETVEHDPRLMHGAATPDSVARLFVLHTPRLGDHAGLGGAIEVRHQLVQGRLQNSLSAEYAATLRRYNRTLFTWEGRPASLQYGYEWRPEDRFYGFGNGTRKQAISDYALQGEFVRAMLTYPTYRGHGTIAGPSRVQLWAGPSSRVLRRGREDGQVSIEERFPGLRATTLDRRVDNLVYGASLVHDQRRGSPHWTRGWRALASAERWDRPVRALALHSAEPAGAQFTRFQGEAETGWSFWRDPRSVRLLGRFTGVRVTSGADRLLPADYSLLGGQAGLLGFGSGRFRDLDALLLRLSYVFPLERFLEMDLHSEWGEVGPDLAADATLRGLHTSAGVSVRPRDDSRPRASAGLDFSREGVRLQFALGGVR